MSLRRIMLLPKYCSIRFGIPYNPYKSNTRQESSVGPQKTPHGRRRAKREEALVGGEVAHGKQRKAQAKKIPVVQGKKHREKKKKSSYRRMIEDTSNEECHPKLDPDKISSIRQRMTRAAKECETGTGRVTTHRGKVKSPNMKASASPQERAVQPPSCEPPPLLKTAPQETVIEVPTALGGMNHRRESNEPLSSNVAPPPSPFKPNNADKPSRNQFEQPSTTSTHLETATSTGPARPEEHPVGITDLLHAKSSIVRLEEYMIWKALTPEWSDRREEWVGEVCQAITVESLIRLVAELESHIYYEFCEREWDFQRDGWLSACEAASDLGTLVELLISLEDHIGIRAFQEGWAEDRVHWGRMVQWLDTD